MQLTAIFLAFTSLVAIIMAECLPCKQDTPYSFCTRDALKIVSRFPLRAWMTLMQIRLGGATQV